MAIKKTELYRSLWDSCDELRGGMDASQYKDYVLVVLFVKYVSDKFAGDPDADLEVPDGGSFADLLALRGKADIGDRTNKVIAKLAEANDLRGVIDVADFNDPDKLGKGKAMVDRLTSLFTIFDNPALDFSGNSADGDDLLGDAYEYLMRHFATESGKSKGQFYTPAEVSRILASVVGAGHATDAAQTIYDPTCGSGSLLLKAHDLAQAATGLDLAVYGQEMDNATAALAKMNTILHGVPTAEIWQDDTLASPHYKDNNDALKKFDYIVANPPFSTKSWSNGFDPQNDEFDRFTYGIPPTKNGDYAFLLHINASLKADGKAAVILPHGVLFRGNAEATIRTELVKRGLIRALIGLPANLFYGTGIPAAIVVLDREGAASRDSILMIDASKGFAKDGPKNRLRERDIHRILDVYNHPADVDGFARVVPVSEIADPRNDYNLNLPRYITSGQAADRQDLEGHLAGGIPNTDLDALAAYWQVAPTLRDTLFTPARPGYSNPAIPAEQVGAAIDADPDLTEFRKNVSSAFDGWINSHKDTLEGVNQDTVPRQLIANLTETVLDTLKGFPLVDPYAVYQNLMEFWAATMRDDVDAVRADGWVKAATPVKIIDKNDKDPVDYTIAKQRYRSPILPRGLVIERYAADQAAALQTAEEAGAVATAIVDEMQTEHGGDEGLLSAAVDDNQKLTKGKVAARLKKLKGSTDPDETAEREALDQAKTALDDLAEAKKAAKVAAEQLESTIQSAYTQLSEDEIVELVVEGKWEGEFRRTLDTELNRVNRHLADRTATLTTRYKTTLPELEAQTADLSQKVHEHLKAMGVQW